MMYRVMLEWIVGSSELRKSRKIAGWYPSAHPCWKRAYLEAPNYRHVRLPEVDRAEVSLNTPPSTFGKILTKSQLARV